MKEQIQISVDKLVEYEIKARLLKHVADIFLLNCELGWEGVSLRLNGEGHKQLEAFVNLIDPDKYAYSLLKKQEERQAEEETALNTKEEKYGNINRKQ